MELIPEEHPMMQYVLRFLLVYSLSDPGKRSQHAQEFASALAERERKLTEEVEQLRKQVAGLQATSNMQASWSNGWTD